MIHWTSYLLLLQGEEKQQGDGSMMSLLITLGIPILIIFFLSQMILGGPQRKEKRRRDAMLKAIKKNDRVVTIGGIIGTVANVGPDGKEVTIKVDDNTRLNMLGSSIQSVLSDEGGDNSSKS